MCKDFGQLPYPGGMLNQPSKLMVIFQHIAAAQAERQALDKKKADKQNARKR